uniref:Phosphatidylethanolamine-binding protein n=1 Tax=Plectus sambesii TaxID=2011161 RepID=A0A914XPZ8_9BILA
MNCLVFTEAGLTPTLVPLAPLEGIASVTLGDAKKHVVTLSDDLSFVPNLLATQPITITTISNVHPKTVRIYHALFFDATNNKDCVFRINIEVPTFGKIIPDLFKLMPNPTAASVYNAGPASAPVYKYSQKYMPPIFNTSPHKFVVLLWSTPKSLPLGSVGLKSTTVFNLNAGLNGDLEPGRVAGKAGSFTTVSALLAADDMNMEEEADKLFGMMSLK